MSKPDWVWHYTYAASTTLQAGLRSLGTRSNCCILATRMLGVLLSRAGIDWRPLPVRAWVFSPHVTRSWLAWEADHPGQPLDNDLLCRWVREHDQGGWSVGVGFPTGASPHGYPGHLVALVDGRLLADVSIKQAERPQFGINLPVLVAPVPDVAALLAGSEQAAFRGTDDVLVKYELHPDPPDWTATPDWTVEKIQHRWLRLLEGRVRAKLDADGIKRR